MFLHYFLQRNFCYLGGTREDFQTKEQDSIVFNGLPPRLMLCVFHHTHTHVPIHASMAGL